jgi:hypothetical protein
VREALAGRGDAQKPRAHEEPKESLTSPFGGAGLGWGASLGLNGMPARPAALASRPGADRAPAESGTRPREQRSGCLRQSSAPNAQHQRLCIGSVGRQRGLNAALAQFNRLRYVGWDGGPPRVNPTEFCGVFGCTSRPREAPHGQVPATSATNAEA